MRTRHPGVLIDMLHGKAEEQPDFDVLTFEHLSLDGGKTPDEVRTYADLVEHGNRIAAWLVRTGVTPGTRFALMMRNHPEFVETMIATSQTGAVFVPIDPRTRGDKLAFMLRHAGCSGVVCADYCLPAVLEAREQAPGVKWVLCLDSGEDADVRGIPAGFGVIDFGEVLAGPAPTVDVLLRDPGDPLQIIYTSGTTGDPKGVMFPNERFGLYVMLGMIAGYQPGARP
jgi:crotonobetaine/carnitine-CoA ligase